MNKTVLGAFIATILLTSLAFANPSSGIPSQGGSTPATPGTSIVACVNGNALLNPLGFNTACFAHTGSVYNSESQYDVGCFQWAQHYS